MTAFVSVIMPVREEGDFIGRSLGSVLAQDHPPELMEVLVVDGRSTDATRPTVERMAEAARDAGQAPVELLDNPPRTAPAALNIGLERAKGDVIVRVDGHCELHPTYIRRALEVLDDTGAACVGGLLETIGESTGARAIARAQSSRFGVGGAAFRVGRAEAGPVDTVAFGAYRRSVLDEVGPFDEELVRNQDDEFNLRLTQAGHTVWLDPSLRTRYHSRATLGRLWRQYFGYGMYKVRVMQKRRTVPSPRHLVPAGFVLGLAAAGVVATRRPKLALAMTAPYAAANLTASVAASRGDPATLPVLPAAFAVLHVAYGAGFWRGLWRWRRRFGDPPEGDTAWG